MKIGFCVRDTQHQFGGDLVAINSVVKGLKNLGHRVFTGPDALSVIKSDYIFITNTCIPQGQELKALRKHKKRWGVIPFHEDFFKYGPTMAGFANYAFNAFNDGKMYKEDPDKMERFDIEYLLETPEIVRCFNDTTQVTPPTSHVNRFIIEEAETVFAHANMEKNHLHQHFPNLNTKVVHWGPGVSVKDLEYNDSILKITGLTKGEYALNIGRIEPRKNQMGVILALWDVDIPIIFVATAKAYFKPFQDKFIEMCRLRPYKTIVISSELEPEETGEFTIISTDGQMLKDEVISSAYQNAGLHIHPAFYEMPGYTYLEAAQYNIPQVASNWTSINEYFSTDNEDSTLGGAVKYVTPFHIKEIRDSAIEQFGKTVSSSNLSILSRSNEDVATEFLKNIQRASYE